MKKLFFTIWFAWVTLLLAADVRRPQDAMRIAADFRAAQTYKARKVQADTAPMAIADSTKAYYAVNTAKGFVLVGADDRLPEVLGYSDNAVFDPSNMAPATRLWLQTYAEELNNPNAAALNPNAAKIITPIEPLVPGIWNQSTPFNDLAPVYNDNGGKCVAGCVATAMAQIMYFHRHPAQGTGSHSYLWICTEPVGKSGTLSANFGATTYDWENMLPSYKGSYNATQANAVSTLLYHCGVSVNMGFGSSSGAYTADVPKALNTYFGYDANYQQIQKIMYSPDSLNAIIYSELAANRPVLVSGHNDEGGHAFVCDGADSRGYFHINWGWGGSNDGYFLLTALNPRGTQGIGGTSKGYNKGTTFFVGLQPAKTNSPKPIPQIAADSVIVSTNSFARSGSFSLSIARIQNYGMTDFSGSYGVGLYDEDETQLIAVLAQNDNYSLRAGYYRTTLATMSSLKIPSSVPAGTYHVCAIYKNADYGWMRMLCTQNEDYFTLTLTSATATFYPNDAVPELILTNPITFAEGMNPDSIPFAGAPLSFSIKNNGGTFRGDVSARIYQGAIARGQYENADSVVVRRNDILSSALQQQFDSNLVAGKQYKMKLCWRAGAGDSWHDFTPAEYASISFKLYQPEEPEIPTAIPNLNNGQKPILLMRMGGYDLYIVPQTTSNGTTYEKILKPHQ